MLKKIFVIVICICISISLLIGCGEENLNKDNTEIDNSDLEENNDDAQNNSEDTKEMYKDKYEVKIDSGRYIGQIDNNSIEIKISGKPDSFEPEAFRLGEEVKQGFSEYSLTKDDEIKFKYYINENDQKVIIFIEKY